MKHMLPIVFSVAAVALIIAGVLLVRKGKVSEIVNDEYLEDFRSAFGGELDNFKTSKGTPVSFFSIKHGSLAVKAGNKWLYFDPVTKAVQPETDYSDMAKADYIFVTHDHYDHFDTLAISQLSAENTSVIANGSVVDALGCGRAMSNGESFKTAEGWMVEAVPAYNNSEDKLMFHPQGRDNGYVVDIEGFRIYVAGDTEVIPELSAIKDIDVAFLPCNLPFTMTPEQCAEAARIVMPKVLFPYHYGDTDMDRLVTLLADDDIDVRIRSYR